MGAPATKNEAPRAFGRYRLIRRLGQGGMGEVFLASEVDGATVRAVVVKKILNELSQNRHFIGRFLDESKVVARLHHPNIARVFSMGEVGGEYFLAMEYVQGKTLSRLGRRLRQANRSFPVGPAFLVAERICAGLSHAHEAKDERGKSLQLVHRDLSPANVCVSYRGEVKIIDFGAAQSTLKEEETAPGAVIGNLAYMAPEQARKEVVGPPADVYSLGAVLWELLTGRPLPQKGDPVLRWRRAANPEWAAPSSVRANLPPEVDEVILRALHKDARQRYPTALAMEEALRKVRKGLPVPSREEDLGALLTSVYEVERVAEERLLKSLLEGSGQEGPDDELTVLVPPNALAFEHDAMGGPMFGQEQTSTLSQVGPWSGSQSVSRMGFGIPLAGEGEQDEAEPGSATKRPTMPLRPSARLLAAAATAIVVAASLLWWLG